MKLHAISTAIVLAGIAGVAMAANAVQTMQPRTLPPITVSQVVSECTRPGDAPSAACVALYRHIQANFTPQEIRMVVAWQASHPQFLFSKIHDLHDRYAAMLEENVAARQAAEAVAVAVATR